MVSLKEIERVLGDDKEALKSILEVYILQTSDQVQKLKACLAAKDLNEIKNIAHKMKSTMIYFGMTDQSVKAGEIESSNEIDLSEISKKVLELTNNCDQAVIELKEILGKMV